MALQQQARRPTGCHRLPDHEPRATARDAANKAADEQAQAQLDAEAAARHQKRLEENSADFKRQRNAQQVKAMVAGGRTGTLMNGTTGFSAGSGDTTGGPTGGSKTLMGK